MGVRKSIVVHGRLAAHQVRIEAARSRAHGLQALTTEQLVARLAGGFARPIEKNALQDAVLQALQSDLGELEPIKTLPGMGRAAVGTLQKVWRAGIDLSACARDHPRLEAVARLEQATLAALPSAMLRPVDLVVRARERVALAACRT